MRKKVTASRKLSAALVLALAVATVVPVAYVTTVDVYAGNNWDILPVDPEPAPNPGGGNGSGGDRSNGSDNGGSGSGGGYYRGLSGKYTENGVHIVNAHIGVQNQGAAAATAFANATPAGYKNAFTFNITVDGKELTSAKNGQLLLYIPSQYQKAGRTFTLLGLDKSGKVVTFKDLDSNYYSFTTSLNIEGYAFDLIYKD